MRIAKRIHAFILLSALSLVLAFGVSHLLQRQILNQYQLVESLHMLHTHVQAALVHKGKFLKSSTGASAVLQSLAKAKGALSDIEPDTLDNDILPTLNKALVRFDDSFMELAGNQSAILDLKGRIRSAAQTFMTLQRAIDTKIQRTIAEGYLYEKQVDVLSMQELRNSILSSSALVNRIELLASQHLLLEGDIAGYEAQFKPLVDALAIQAGNVTALALYLENKEFIGLANILTQTLMKLKEVGPKLLMAYEENQDISATMETEEQTIETLAKQASGISRVQRLRADKFSTIIQVVGISSMIALMLLGGYYFSRSIVAPLRKLTSATEAMHNNGNHEHTDLPLPLETGRRDELGELARAFEEMQNAIIQKVVDLESMNEMMTEQNQELERLRNMLNNVVNSMPSILIGVTPDGVIMQWNREAEKQTGISPDEAIGQPLQTTVPRLANEMDRIHTAIETRQEVIDHKRGRREEDETHYEDLTIYPLIANGVTGAVIRLDDVTDRVNLEQVLIQSEKMMSVGGLAAGMAHSSGLLIS